MKRNILKNKFNLFHAVILGIGLTFASSVTTFASTGDAEVVKSEASKTDIGKALFEKQQKIDKYVFEDHVKEIEEKGFSVTYTGPMEDYIEIGIIPFNEENADYLYKIFGKDGVKVVEGQKVALMTGEVTTTAAPDDKAAGEDAMISKQAEVDTNLFEKSAKEIEKKGFKVTHTAPLKDHVEIGITPFNEENAEYIYGLVGKDKIKVVKGEQAQLMNDIATTTAVQTNDEAKTSNTNPLIYAVIAIATIGAIVVVLHKKKVLK
jgi:arginine repressor